MAQLLLLTNSPDDPHAVLPALALLSHSICVLPSTPSALVDPPVADAISVDARHELIGARDLSRLLSTHGQAHAAIVLVINDTGWAAVSTGWGMHEVILDRAGPSEVEARLRVAVERAAHPRTTPAAGSVDSGGVSIDESAYAARVHGRVLDLTYKEFELLKYLANTPGRVHTRDHLLQQVWGYDYFGGTRTVDVHVRRLRAKLGPEHEHLIGTVRNVGYRFVVGDEAEPGS